jgi:hypothetical protein
MPWLAPLHLFAFHGAFAWRISEAENPGVFLVTLGRDLRIGLPVDAESRFKSWLEKPVGSVLREAAEPAGVLVAYEDRRFWFHPGVDPLMVVAVLLRRRRAGASTVPMQLARQLITRPHPSKGLNRLRRKLFEAALGCYLVLRLGRRRVLGLWLSIIPFGRPDICGIEIAAQRYFGKEVRELDAIDGLLLAERATIASGRYYPNRVPRLTEWATRRGLIPASAGEDVQRRFALMQTNVPANIGPS